LKIDRLAINFQGKLRWMIGRDRHLARIRALLRRHPVVAIIGARQVGKTTLARQLVDEAKRGVRFDLEDPRDLARLSDPMLALQSLEGLVVLDEIQRQENLFPILRVLADRPDNRARFLVLGSASPDLLRQASESLAGRIYYYELGGLDLSETGIDRADALWLRGGFPRSFVAKSDDESIEWRRAFIQTFLSRDMPQLGIRIPADALYRFWMMLAHYHAQVWNGSELARAFGVGVTTVRRYLDVLTSALVLRQLPPWFENISKRQVRAPKVYIADPGLLHALLGVETLHDLLGHPKAGASWEGFVLSELIDRFELRREECYFWATHAGAELDLLALRKGKRIGVEIKRTSTPQLTRSMRAAMEDLRLDRLVLIHAGSDSFPLAKHVQAVALSRLDELSID
jgi:predicted AAA+ superfamily ATPase